MAQAGRKSAPCDPCEIKRFPPQEFPGPQGRHQGQSSACSDWTAVKNTSMQKTLRAREYIMLPVLLMGRIHGSKRLLRHYKSDEVKSKSLINFSGGVNLMARGAGISGTTGRAMV
jgi:hypothetical protein